MYINSTNDNNPFQFFQSIGEKVGSLVDTSILELFEHLENAMVGLGSIFTIEARVIAAIMMLIYLLGKAYDLITGDGKLDILPLLRPFIFFMIVANWGGFIAVMRAPLQVIDDKATASVAETRAEINALFDKSRQKQKLVYSEIRRIQTIEQAAIKKLNLFDVITNPLNALSAASAALKASAIKALSHIAELIQTEIQATLQKLFLNLVAMVFKACTYFVRFVRVLMIGLLVMIGPFVFALAIVNSYRDLHLQWISKFVSVSLYGAFAHLAIMVAYVLIKFALKADIARLDAALATMRKTDAGIVQAIATLATLTAGGTIIPVFVTGIFCLLCVPVIATWILGSNSTTAIGNKAASAASSAVGAVTKTALKAI